MSDSEDSSPSDFTDEHFTPTAITAAWPPLVTIASHGFSNGQALRATRFITYPVALATGMEQLNNKLFYVQQATTNTFILCDANAVPIDGRNFTPFVHTGKAQFTLVGPDLFIQNPAPTPP